MLAQIAELIDIIGPHPAARWAYEQLSPYAELFVVEGIGAAVRGSVHYPLSLLATAMGDLRELLARPGTSIAALDLATSPGERRRVSQDGLF